MATYRTTVILKTDIVDSTPRLAGLTHAEMSLQRKQHKQFISGITAQHRGSVFDEEGDAYWIEFPSVTDAVRAAIEMHQTLHSTQAGKGEKQRLVIRAVITVGDILHQDSDSMGMTMSLTARLEKITPPDEIYLSHAAWLILNKAEVQTSLVGEFNFKGFSEPERIYRVAQKHRTRVLTDQFIVFIDAKGFTRFVKLNNIEIVEKFLLDCDDLINGVCEEYGGVLRQVIGDQYFLTFVDAHQTINAIETLCRNWKRIVEVYKVGISIGIHKGSLNIVRSYLYGDDIHTAVYLSEIDKIHHPNREEVCVITSGKVKDEFKGTNQEGKFLELQAEKFTQEIYNMILHEHGAHQFTINNQ